MKFLVVFVIATFLATAKSKLRFKQAAVTNCPLLPVNNSSQTLFFDMDAHPHPELKTCILKNNLSEKSVLLLSIYGTKIDIKVNVTRRFIRTTDNPNVILMTKYLTLKMLESPLWQFFIRSNWSLLYIIVTDDNKFKCNKNGTMNTQDFKLLENILNTLWHKYQIMRIGVVFPLVCKQKMVIYSGKKPSSRILYDRSIKLIKATKFDDLNTAIRASGKKLTDGYPMQGHIFYRHPTSIKNCTNLHYYVPFNLNLTLGYCGLDGMVMHDILLYLKFNFTVPDDAQCNNYGYAVPGNVSGTLGCIIRKELDISFNSRFMTLYSDEHIYYLHYVTTDTLCALVKKPDVVPLWQGVFNLFSPSIWFLISAVLVIIGGIMWVTAMINKIITGKEIMTFWRYVQKSVIMTIFGYAPSKLRTFQIIRTSCLTGSIFFLAIYQGHTSRMYTTVKRYDPIKTLQQLYASDNTLYTSPSVREFMRQLQDPEDKLQAEFFERTQIMPGDRLGVVLQHTSAVTVDRKSDAELEISQVYSDEHGTPLIDIVDECFSTYYLSYIARSGYPFYEEIKRFVERLSEAGLPTKYYKWTHDMLEIPNPKMKRRSEPRYFYKIKLEDHRIAFGILFVGTVVSALVFAVELWNGRRNHPKLYKRRS